MSDVSPNPLCVGVWIQLPPNARWRTEGIGRLIGYIIDGTTARGTSFVLLAPPWMETEMRAFIEELPARSRNSVELRTAPLSTWRWKLFTDFNSEGRKREPPDWINRWVARLVNKPSYAGLFVGASAMLVWRAGRAINPMRWIRNAMNWADPIGRIQRRLARSALADFVSPATLIQAEYNANIAYADRQKDIDVWIAPYPGFTAAENLTKPLVLIFPDYVLADFPENFGESSRTQVEAQFARTVGRADRIISFTEDVRSRHVVGVFGAPREKTAVIPHCIMDISASWGGPPVSPRSNASRDHAKSLIHRYARETLSTRTDLPHARHWGLLAETTDFSALRYAFCPQQARPYKNLVRLVELVTELNRSRGVPLHLVVSSFINLEDAADPFVVTLNRLSAWEYLTVAPALPSDVHAAFYHAAEIALHPSYFEGGLSFIFGEAVSMGTPCLLSKNAANMESLSEREHDYMLFDPSSIADFVDKTIAALSDREGLLAKQQAYVQHIERTRGWDKVALEYLDVLRSAQARAGHA